MTIKSVIPTPIVTEEPKVTIPADASIFETVIFGIPNRPSDIVEMPAEKAKEEYEEMPVLVAYPARVAIPETEA